MGHGATESDPQRTSHRVRPGEKVVPWLYLSLVWCSTFHCMLPGASRNKSTTKHSWAEWHIGGTGETPPDPPPGPRWSWAEAAATFLLGESQELPTSLQAKSGARKEGNATQSLHPRSVEGCTCMHSWEGCTETTYAWLRGAQTHTGVDTQTCTMMAATTAPLSEQQLIPLGLPPPHRLARGGTFLCHKHSGRASATCTAAAQLGLPGLLSSSAHATKPCLLLCFCRLLQHLPPHISTAPALCDLPISNPSNCPAFSTAFLQTLRHFS